MHSNPEKKKKQKKTRHLQQDNDNDNNHIETAKSENGTMEIKSVLAVSVCVRCVCIHFE